MAPPSPSPRRPPRPSAAARCLAAIAGLAFSLLLLSPLAPACHAQQTLTITGDRLAGSVLPVEPLTGDIELTALRAYAWTVDDTKRLLLEGDVQIRVGAHLLVADSAVVWINRLPSAEGPINQIAMYFENLANPTRPAGVRVAGRRLLMTGSARGEVVMRVSLLIGERPRGAGIVTEGENRLAKYLRGLIADPPRLAWQPQVDRLPPPYEFTPVPGGSVVPRDYELPSTIELPPAEAQRPWLHEPGAELRLAYGTAHLAPGEEENVISVTGSVVIDYYGRGTAEGELSQFTLAADRAVIFTDPGSVREMAQRRLDVSMVRGIYLEGNASASANDGEQTIRAPRLYYDFTRDRAVMLDAVLRTYDRRHHVPVYARAEELRQIAQNQWTARRARVSTSEFHTGHFSLGAERMTVTRRPAGGGAGEGEHGGAAGGGTVPTAAAIAAAGAGAGGGEMETYVDAKDITLRAGTFPFFYWPHFAGTVQDVPLKSIQVGGNDNDGVRIRTTWDLLTLIGGERPAGIEVDLKLDGYTKRGPAVGLDLDYDRGGAVGNVDLYGLHDDGTDRTSSGLDVTPPEPFRGVALWEHQAKLSDNWSLQGQASYISDPTFITSWRERDFKERREYETSAYLKWQKDRAALTVLGKDSLQDFISNDYLLASAQYVVDKFPEGSFRTYGNPLGKAMTYSSETRAGLMSFDFEESTPNELGVPAAAFGVPANVPVADRLRAEGYPTRNVFRFDTRHELVWTADWGGFRIDPFIVGRLTAYDTSFEDYSSDAERTRIFGAAGVRVHTQLQHVDNRVENRLFDLHRLRHVVEPSVTLWYGYSNAPQEAYPIYDLNVESIATGAAVRAGVRNTWQTQRGGPGRWRSVDVLTVDANVAFNSGDADPESPTPQFFDFRPEYSQFGNHVEASAQWLLSDTLSISGEGTYDLDDSVLARGSIGAELRHSPLLTSFVEYRYIEASSNELLGIGWSYRLTPKYLVSVTPQWDFQANEFRSVDLLIVRSFPDFDLSFSVSHDQIRDETTVAASLQVAQF